AHIGVLRHARRGHRQRQRRLRAAPRGDRVRAGDADEGADAMKDVEDGRALEALLEHLRGSRGFDFTGYKRSSLARRVSKRVKIYATDIDEDAVTQARQGSYSAQDLEPVPPDLRDRYFERAAARHVFRKELRQAIIFGNLNLVQDAPISRLDLLVCRNTLMYFNLETQRQVLARFHFALNHAGFLFLGRAEMLLMHTSVFTPVNLKHRVFVKTAKINLRD